MTTTTATNFEPCGRCRSWMPPGALQCPVCGEFPHRATLERLSAEALAREAVDPLAAAAIWEECLRLVPADAPQSQQIRHRIAALANRAAGAPAAAAPTRRDDPLPTAIFKTLGSMAISIAVYGAMTGGNWAFATGFVLLILIHELGHVAAMRYYGLSASPPIFIPFVGALINLRESPKNAKEEAVVGIAGPVAGAIASAACLAWAIATPHHQTLFFLLAYFGFMINLFNMLPVPPLDGGRVTAAVSPWIWMPGIGVLVVWILYDLVTGAGIPWMLTLLLFYAWPRVWATLKGRQRLHPYYAIGRAASVAIGAAYLLLGVGLLAGFLLTSTALSP